MPELSLTSELHGHTGSSLALACRLRLKPAEGLPGLGEVELENLSQETLVISYQMSPLQYLEFTVIGPSQQRASEGHFGDRFSPLREERVLALEPGEKFTADVPLLGTVPREKRIPGVYKVQAVFAYNGIHAASNTVEVFWPATPPVGNG